MATVKKIKKAQDGYMGKKAPKDSVYTETGRLISKKENDAQKKEFTKSMNDQFFSRPENKKFAPKKAVAPKKKMKDGGSFPDLSGDKKVTQKDVLIAKGVLPKPAKKSTGKAKNGKSMKAMSGMHMMPDGSMMKNSMMKMGGKMKSGGKMKTCKYGC